MSPRPRAEPTPALRELYELDEQLGVDPLAPSRVVVVPASAPAGPPFVIPPPPWSVRYQGEGDE